MAVASPSPLMSSSTWRARCNPRLMSLLPSRCGSKTSPFQPTVVRGFFKIGAHDYLKAVFIGGGESCQPSGIVQGRDGIMDGAGPITTSRRSSSPARIRRALMALVVDVPGHVGRTGVLRQQLGRVGSASMAKARMTEFKTAIWSYLVAVHVCDGEPVCGILLELTGSRLIAVAENDCYYLGVCLKCKRNEIARRRWGERTMAGELQQKQAASPREEARQSQDKEGSAVHHGVPVLMVGVFILPLRQ